MHFLRTVCSCFTVSYFTLFRIQEDTAEYIASLKASHQREVEKILCQHAKEHSTSKVAELNSRISTQEVRYSRYIHHT